MAAPGIKFCVGHSEMSSSRASASSQDHCNKTFTDFSHHVLYQVNVQRFYGAFCDVAVKVENFSFKAHKCILAAGSPKLQTMLYDYHPDRSHVLHLRDVTVNGFKCILDFLYTGHLKFDTSSFSEVMSASRILQMPDIEQACIEFQFYRDMMSVPGSGTALPGSSSTSSTQAQPGIPTQLPQQTTQLGVSGQHHLSSLTQQERVSSSQLQQQTQSSRLSSHPSFHTTTHPPKLDLIDQPRYTAQGLQQMKSSRYPTSSSSQQISHNHESQVHTGGQYGGTVSQSHVSEIQTEPITPSSLDLNYSPTYKSSPPGGGHPTQSTNRSTGHSSSVSQHLGFSKGSASHSHSSNTSSLPFLQGHMLGGQGHLLQDQGHIEPISQPGTQQPIMSVTPPPNQNHPAAHGSLALTPISTMDTNCIEDYLKMIESMQTEQQIQQQSTYGASTSTKTNQMQTTPVSDTLAGSSVPTAPPLPKPYQHKTPSTGTRNPKKDYIASADIAAASMASSALSSSSQVSVSSQVNQKSLSLSTSAGSGTRNQYSTEDVRKTLLSVLSQQFDVTGDAAPVGQDTHGSQYSTQNSLTAKDGNIYSQPHSTYSNKYYSGNVSGSHSSVSPRLNFDNMPSQNSHGYANPAVDATGYASSNQYVGQYGGIEYSSHYDTNVDSTSVYSANSPAQALAPAHDGPSGGSRMNYMNTAALVATSSGRSSLQYSTRDQEALSMMNSYSVMQDRLSRLTPVDDNIATSALSSDSEMDGLTMEAIESLAEKITAKDTPEDNVTPVQGERSSSPANLMSRLSPISLASEPSYPQTTGEQEDILSGSQSHNEPPKLLSLAAQTSLQAMLPQENQSHTQPITSGGKPGILPAVSLQSAPQLPNTSETAINIIPQSYTQPISPPSPLSPDFGMEDRKLKMKKKRKVPLKIKLKRNYSSEHWDTFSFPSTNQCVPIPGQQPEGTNHNSVLPNRFTFPASIQRDTQNSSSRFKDSSSLLTANHIGAQQSSLHSSADSSSQHIMQSSASFVSSLPNQQHFDHNTQTVQGSQNDYVASPPPFSWEDLTPSNQSTVQSGKLSTVQERTQANVPQMPAKLRLSNNHQNMYYGSLTTCANHNNAQTTTTSQTSQELPSNNHGNSTLFTSPQGNSMTTTYGIQNYDPISENSNPERGLEELLEKSSDNYYEINSSTVSSARLEQDKTNVAKTSSSANKVSGNSGYSNESAPPEKSEQPTKLASSDTVSLTTINKDDLISEIDSLRRDHEESQAIERTKLKKKKKFFISADNDSSVGSPKDSPKYRILKKKYRHSFVRSVNEKVKKPSAEKLNKKKREKKDKKVHQHHGMSTLEKKRSKALEIRKEAENRPLKKRLQLKPVPIKKEPSNKVKMKICPKCSREFYRFARYKMHMQLHFNGEGHACSKCSMLFNRLSDVTMHMRQHNNVKFECTECLQIYSDAKDFKKHMIEVHQDTNCFKCTEPGCGYKAARMSLLEAHIETHKENKSYVCTSCGKSFKQANGLRNHMKSCVPSKTYLCEFCPSKFNRLESLKTHARTHTGDKPHKCPECGAGFTDPKNLNRHRRIHLNQYPYPCKHCDKKFRHSNTLTLHVLRQHKNKNNTATKDV